MATVEEESALPLLPMRETVVFPHVEYPIVIGRARSVAAVEITLQSEQKSLIVVAQRDSTTEDPGIDDLYPVACRAYIRKMQRLPASSISLHVQGIERVEILDIDNTQLCRWSKFRVIPEPRDSGDEVEALHRVVLEQAGELENLMAGEYAPGLLSQLLQSRDEILDQVYLLSSALKLNISQQQAILAAKSRKQALELVHEYLKHEINVQSLQKDIARQAAENVSQEQRQYMLRRQLEEIQKELGEQGPKSAEVDELRDRLLEAELPENAREVAEREIERLSRFSPESQEFQIGRAYLELVLDLPWNKSTPPEFDLDRAREILDEDHFDLKEIKDRIIEYLAVFKLNPGSKGAILCFSGGPGVGKTSIGASIARSLGRKFERISLGGVHDEAELRGHRRTYIGAMPGKIIQAVRRTGVNNPVILFDEVDKLGQDFRGDPAAALMEILDPAQNRDFRDNYVDIPFDLSNVFFLATANTLDRIPAPLLDRMEVLRLSGYTEDEKVQIAQRYLLPRQLDDVKLKSEQINIPEEVLRHVVRHYTREAGVRELQRQVAALVRKSALPFAKGSREPVTVSVEQVSELLGPTRFSPEEMRRELVPGVSVGLAWTAAGGDILFIESVLVSGGKGLTLTGQLGEVMKESAQTAHSYLWSQADKLGISLKVFKTAGVHIHIPAGSIPKDGPSAGVTIATSLLSLLTGKPVRSDTAMTGEISLAGLVLPVGGIKEKVLAAHRAGLHRIILPKENLKDLQDIDESVRQLFEFIPVTGLPEVFAAAIADGLEERQSIAWRAAPGL